MQGQLKSRIVNKLNPRTFHPFNALMCQSKSLIRNKQVVRGHCCALLRWHSVSSLQYTAFLRSKRNYILPIS